MIARTIARTLPSALAGAGIRPGALPLLAALVWMSCPWSAAGADAPAQEAASRNAQPPSARNAAGNLETLVVRAARQPLPAAKFGGSATVLGRELLAQRQGIPLGDLLRSVPGLAVGRAGAVGGQTQLRMRGGEANQVLVFIDGVKANDPAQGSEFNAAHLFNQGIESIAVIRGPQSSLWGSDALSGLIDIATWPAGEGSSGSLLAEGGSNAWQRYGARFAHQGERWQGKLGAAWLRTDGQNIARSGSERDGYENATLDLGLRRRLARSLNAQADLRYSDSANAFDGVDFATGLPVDRDNQTDATHIQGRAAIRLERPDGRWNHLLSYALTDTDNRNRTENAFAPSGFERNSAAGQAAVYGYQGSFAPVSGQRLTAAFERREESFRQRGPVSFGDPNRDERLTANSWVLEYRGDFRENLHILASGRRDRNSDFGSKNTGRLSAAWRIGGGPFKARGAWGTGIKNPSFTERFGYFDSFIGNPELAPEQAEGWEAGFDIRPPGDLWQFSLSWFDERLRDEINGFVFDAALGGFTARNDAGLSKRKGLELNGRWQPAAGLSLSFAYTWLDATEEDPGTEAQVREIRRPEHAASLNLNWRSPDRRVNLNLHLDCNGRQDDYHFPPSPPYRQRVRLDGFVLATLAASYRLGQDWQAFARLENGLNERYEEVFGFQAPRRTFYAGVRRRFGR